MKGMEENDDELSDVDKEESSLEENSESESEGELRQELSEIPFGELQELKEKVGAKRYNQAIHGLMKDEKKNAKGRFKRENKNRPREISSKKKIPKLRQVIEVHRKTSRDPRFDDLSGTFNEDLFRKSYSFLDDIKTNEKRHIKTEMKKTKNKERREELESLLKRMEQKDAAEKAADARKEAERKRKKAEMALVKQGKKPFYLKKSEKKKLELAEKYQQLKTSGKLERFLAKRRKKNASKERRRVPRRRGIDTN